MTNAGAQACLAGRAARLAAPRRCNRPAGRRRRRLGVCLLLATLAAACTSEQIYNSAQGWRRNECYKIGDLDQRERCLKDANRPYGAYRAASGQNR